MADVAKGGIPEGFVVVRKWGNTPPDVEQSMREQGMGTSSGVQWGPGRPLNPAWGYGGTPRKLDFQPGHNIGRHFREGRVSFDALKTLAESWDFAQICIRRRIDDIRSLGWSIVAADGETGNVDTAVAFATQLMKYPEGPGSRMRYGSWVAKWLQSVLKYDAGTLYRRRDRAGRVCGLSPVPGATIQPLLDTWGGTPSAPAPAYTQWIRGQAVKQFTVDDLIYEPFMPQDDSPFGMAPLEAVILAANTDLRMQAFLLQHFTSGTIPEGFATAPEELSTPDQVGDWQQWWDAVMYGDMEAKQQLKWVPAGTNFHFPKDRKFDKDFAMWMAGKCAAAFGINMNDLGFIEDVNRANGETQTEIQFRVGTLPLVKYLQDIVNDYLQNDRGLPVKFVIDTGQEKDDREAEARTHSIWIECGVESPDEVRRDVLGLPVDNERPTPRFINHANRGPIPLLDIVAAAGEIDVNTYGPDRGQALPADPAVIPGVIPEHKTTSKKVDDAAMEQAQEAIRALLHPDAPPREVAQPTPAPAEIAQKDATAGVSAATGFTGNSLAAGAPVDDDERERVVKAATVAGLAVVAANTGRVLMLQRCLDSEDPAAGTWEFPGGHLEGDEDPLTGACREWAEEVGARVPPGITGGTWDSPNGVYRGHVWIVPSEESVRINLPGDHPDRYPNPDDPDGDLTEAVAWFDPADLPGMPALRNELRDTLALWLPVVRDAHLREVTQVIKDLQRWRNIARRRVVKSGGLEDPSRFTSHFIPHGMLEDIGDRLRVAQTREQVDDAFTAVVKAGGPGKGVAGAS